MSSCFSLLSRNQTAHANSLGWYTVSECETRRSGWLNKKRKCDENNKTTLISVWCRTRNKETDFVMGLHRHCQIFFNCLTAVAFSRLTIQLLFLALHLLQQRMSGKTKLLTASVDAKRSAKKNKHEQSMICGNRFFIYMISPQSLNRRQQMKEPTTTQTHTIPRNSAVNFGTEQKDSLISVHR